jgi:hypothetical protein
VTIGIKNPDGVPWVIPKLSALLCWPVEWSDLNRPKPNKNNLHVSCIYMPDATTIPKTHLIELVKDLEFSREYRIGKIEGVDAFGPEKTYPVLRVDTHWSRDLSLVSTYTKIAVALHGAGIEWDRWEPYNPHCTVDIQTILNPPKRVILRPLELWYMDDEPVLV